MRDQRIDFWRGLCVVGMAVWHMLSHTSFPRWFTFPLIQGLNFVAEGFVLVSGVCVGLGFSRHVPGSLRCGHYLRRAVWILTVHYMMVSVLWVGAWAGVIRIPYWPPLSGQSIGHRLWAIVSLADQPYLADILSLFFFLFLTTPIFLFLLHKVGAWGLAGIGFLIYLGTIAFAWAAPSWHRLWELNADGAFDWNSWQWVYGIGIVLGAGYARWEPARAASWARKTVGWVGLAWLAMAGLYLALKLHFPASHPVQKFLLDRHPLGPVRLGHIGLQLALIGLGAVAWWETLQPFRFARLLVLFGRHSLTVFVCSVFLDYLFKQAIDRWQIEFPIGLLFVAAELVLLAGLAWAADKWPSARKNPPAAA